MHSFYQAENTDSHLEALGHGFYGSIAKKKLTKIVKKLYKKSWSYQRGGDSTMDRPPLYATDVMHVMIYATV